VVNPVALLATALAFQGDRRIVGLRMAMTLSVALTVGLLASGFAIGTRAQPRVRAPVRGGSNAAIAAPVEPGSGGAGFFAYATVEFFDVMFFIVLGALFTAATQTLVPRGDLTAVGGRPVASVLTLMPVATLLSICSEADAFVARAFATTFSVGAVLAFMTIGQIVDLRNGALLFRTLGGGLVTLILSVSYVLVFLESVLVNAFLGWP
jgi:uncharacterized membrane protein YraQ (UPF0718 family)